MAERSRIRINPTTREIEVEGTEAFVKKYFDLLSDMLREIPAPQQPTRSAGSGRSASPAAKGNGGTTNTEAILQIIRKSKAGVTTPELSQKTGLSDKQIWPIIYKAEKLGKIKKAARGRYVAVA